MALGALVEHLDSLTTTTPGTGIVASGTAPNFTNSLVNVTAIVETNALVNTAIVYFQVLLADGTTWFQLPGPFVNTKNRNFAIITFSELLPTIVGIRPVLSATASPAIVVSLQATLSA